MYFNRIGNSDKGDNMYFNRIGRSDKGENMYFNRINNSNNKGTLTVTISLYKFSPSIVMRPKSRPAETATPALPYSRIHPLSIFFSASYQVTGQKTTDTPP
jgi:hypothetical protein